MVELIEWLNPFFGDHTASAAFDYGSSKASAAGHVFHKSMRLYLDLTKVSTRGQVYAAVAHVKRYLALHPFAGAECFVNVPDPIKKAKNAITGKALSIFKRFLRPEFYRIEWGTQSIWLKIVEPSRRTVRLVSFDRSKDTWVVEDESLFNAAFKGQVSPEEFVAQATP